MKSPQASQSLPRRSFLKTLGSAGILAPAFVRHLISAPPSGRVRLASFGANGMAWADLQKGHLTHPNVDLVAVAEVDSRRLDKIAQINSDRKIRLYEDWRKLLEEEGSSLDAVSVGTPDHMHAPIGASAMQLGLHAYIQKPLAHNLHEVRRLTEIARDQKVHTQMGIQVHSSMQYRTAVQVVQSGVVGKIREVHTWSNKKWGDSEPAPSRKDPVPSGLAWDLWLGVAAGRDYIDGLYHPGNWRKRLDFGTGTLGDMGCHIFDPVFKALGVGAPLSVRSEGAPPNDWSWSTDAVIHYTFPASRFTEGQTVKVTWYDGDQRPPPHIQSLLDDAPLPQQGSIFIGTKGQILVPHIDFPKLFPLEDFRDHPYQKLEGLSHHGQFIDAILGKAAPTAGFDYSGALTEAVLLGSLATFYPQTTLEWDSPALRFKNHEEANQRIRRTYRTGWEVPSLA